MTSSTAPLPSLLGYSFSELEDRLRTDGLRAAHAQTLWRALHQHPAGPRLDPPLPFPPPLCSWVEQHIPRDFHIHLPSVTQVIESEDRQTFKFLLRLEDGQEIETVIMRYSGRFTLCLSTQAGCALGCTFCATGQMGFVRHLRINEMVGQVAVARKFLHEAGLPPPRNLVLMGMGEPLHNYDSVMHALDILSDTRAYNIGPSHITVSTVGLVPAIRRYTEEARPYNLAVSLHASNDTDRTRLMPVNRRWPLAELMDACRDYTQRLGRKIFFGYTLVAGQNDSPQHAQELLALLRGIRSHINLIPLNPTGGFSGEASAAEAARAFHRILRLAGMPSTLRQRRGIDVAAGCGQLKALNLRRGIQR